MSCHVCVGSFNILADGLSSGEFLCEGGDAGSTDWTIRKDKLVCIIANMLNKCDVVVTQENDHFIQILSELRDVYSLNVGGVFGANVSKPSKANQLKVARQFKTLCNNDASKTASTSLPSLYEECNRCFQTAHIGSISFNSFNQESASFGAAFAGMYNNQPNDLYRSDDGVGIYYRMDKLQLNAVHLPGTIAQCISISNLTLVSNMDCVLACTFQVLTASPPNSHTSTFTVYGAHLSSGEDVTKEHARCRQLYAILSDAQHRVNPVIAMDNNSSVYYETAYEDTQIELVKASMATTLPLADTAFDERISCQAATTSVTNYYIPGKLSTLIEQFNYIDAVGPQYQSGNECFKMRHGQGGQPSKHYQFMFDTIDKILVPKSVDLLPYQYDRTVFGFARYDPTLRESLVHLRTSLSARRGLETFCRSSEQVNSTTCSEIAFGREHLLSGLYPNKQAPSDHPPVSCCFVLG